MTHSIAEQRRVADATDLCHLLRKSVAKSIINLVIIIIFAILTSINILTAIMNLSPFITKTIIIIFIIKK